jgi:hypothetical protein|tara:strand:+ start:424 stop:756 length:333 start_codon:yes stop_codon:yes gene_type:complete
MVARNPNNLISFGHTHGIAEDIEMFTVDGGATLAGETNPGEAMEKIISTIGTKATILAVGAEDTAGAFRVMLHGSAWTDSDMQTAIRALGATVGSGNYDATGATVAAFTF